MVVGASLERAVGTKAVFGTILWVVVLLLGLRIEGGDYKRSDGVR